MERDYPGNADYSFKDMTEYSLLVLFLRLSNSAAISPLILHTFKRLLCVTLV